MTGWKLGWAYGPKAIIRNLQIAHQNCLYMCHTSQQEAVAVALEKEFKLLGTPQSCFSLLVKELTEKKDKLVSIVEKSGMIPIIPQGGYFLIVDWHLIGK